MDSFFGATSAVTPADQNAFIASLQNNGVKFMISGHDHLYNRALDKSPDGLSEVMQIVTQGISTKFYAPQARMDVFGAAIKARETQISQEVNNFGYYIYTVDGPRVTADYYSDAIGNFKDGVYYPNGDPNADPPVLGSLLVPNFAFVKNDSWGYSLNGKQFLVKQGDPYSVVVDNFGGTAAKILNGTNKSTATDYTPGTPPSVEQGRQHRVGGETDKRFRTCQQYFQPLGNDGIREQQKRCICASDELCR